MGFANEFRRALAVAQTGTEDQVRARHVASARAILDQTLAERPVRPLVEQVVDGKKGAALEAVKVPGVILFRLGVLQEVAAFALKAAFDLSPVRSGRYRLSWLAMKADGKPHDGGPLGPDEIVFVVNPQPYARKIQVRGAKLVGIAPGIADRVANAVRASFGDAIRVEVKFIALPNAYALKRGAKGRKDSKPGRAITYPAVMLRQRTSFD